MSDPTCKDCQHFRQHYGLNDHRLFRLNCGHCITPRLHKRTPYTPACGHFSPAPAPTDPFVSKEYLSKELLRYVLSLELLPEIHDEPDP